MSEDTQRKPITVRITWGTNEAFTLPISDAAKTVVPLDVVDRDAYAARIVRSWQPVLETGFSIEGRFDARTGRNNRHRLLTSYTVEQVQ